MLSTQHLVSKNDKLIAHHTYSIYSTISKYHTTLKVEKYDLIITSVTQTN